MAKIALEEFLAERAEVLQAWPTGKDVHLEEAIEYQKSIPDAKRFSSVLKKADLDRETLIQPRAGVALPQEHLALLKHLQDEGHADLLPTTIDSYTRHNRYVEAQVGIDESIKTGKSLLNGFPAVNHGVTICRSLNDGLKVPPSSKTWNTRCTTLS